jgi:hypothetical protein
MNHAGILRSSPWDAVLIVLAFVYAGALLLAPTIPLIAIGIWWSSNTIAHIAVHAPLFVSPALNRSFSLFLTVLVGIPQTLWRERHLAHHGGRDWRLRDRRSVRLQPDLPQPFVEVALVGVFWASLAAALPDFFLGVYVPGYLAGLGLCALQGHYEHARGTTSHYGRIYNLLCFNDGYHVEHHERPGLHWTRLPDRLVSEARTSRWPPLLRWLDGLGLEMLERLVLRSPRLQRFVLESHRRALARLVSRLPGIDRVAIVGGGLFPRTALILRDLLPGSRLVIIDADADNLQTARTMIGGAAEYVHRRYRASEEAGDFDLVVIPLSLDEGRDAIYEHPPAKAVLVHDWLWRARGESAVVSAVLLKRLNLVRT